MNTHWDLSIIYNGFDTEEFKNDMSAFDAAVEEVISFAGILG